MRPVMTHYVISTLIIDNDDSMCHGFCNVVPVRLSVCLVTV